MKDSRIVYISGSITNNPNYKEDFEKAEKNLLKDYDSVINPTKLPVFHDKTWESYMKTTLAELLECDAIFMVKGWQESRGAVIEYNLASELGLALLC